MIEFFRRLVWFFIVAAILAYAVFLVGGTIVQERAIADTRVVVVRDFLKVGEHHLSGMVMVPSSCTQLITKAVQISESAFQLKFSTWEEPYTKCKKEDTPRAFRTIVFAPSVGVEFSATLDGAPLTISVVQATEHRY